MGTVSFVVPIVFYLLFFENVSSQSYKVPNFLKNKYGSHFSSSGVKTGGTKTFTKTKTAKSPYASTGYKSYSSYSNGGGANLPGSVSYSSVGGVYSQSGSVEGSSNSNAMFAGGIALPGDVSIAPFVSSYVSKLGGHAGGCHGTPPSPMNAGVTCTTLGPTGGCKAICRENYQFPNGLTQVFFTCEGGEWKVQGSDLTSVQSCLPICLPECQNKGICVAPNQCECSENFSGPQCQFENKPCLNYPPMPKSSKRSCSRNQCTITCLEGHKFPDGSSIGMMVCKGGQWVPTKEKWVSFPDCEATCDPPCLNGGNCLSFNVCQCPQDFRGPQCQYSADACSPKNLQFNGGYKCSGDQESFSCSLHCPDGIQFEFQPESSYKCLYSTGVFQPSPVPQCVYGPNMNVIPSSGSSHSFFHTNISNLDMNSVHNIIGGVLTKETITKTGRKYHYTSPEKFFNDTNTGYVPIGYYGKYDNQLYTVDVKLPKPGSCFSWGGSHYKTFDGKIMSFDTKCPHILVRDAVDNTFSIVVQNHPDCYANSLGCYKIIRIYFQDKEYFLKRSDEGNPIFASTKKVLPIPGQLPGLRVEMLAHYILVTLDSLGVKLKWDGEQIIQVEAKESLWNRTEGLCGRIDGDVTNDGATKDGQIPSSVVTLASSWKVDDFDNICNEEPNEEHFCNDKADLSDRATEFCKKLLFDPRFKQCTEVLDVSMFLEACRWDYCSCKHPDPSVCACDSMNVLIRDCHQKGIAKLSNWRDENTCPMKCTGGKIYKPCGLSKGQPVCGAAVEISEEEEEENTVCEEGCYCPEGTVLHENSCISKDACPCRLRGKNFPPGASVPKECNTCTCSQGQWVCTQVSCGARCAAVGDPHYTTFDGKRYDFMGQCSYYLVKTDNFSIEAENVACAGAISKAMNFPTSVSSGLPSCTKTITIRMNGQKIHLKQNHDVVVNGQDVSKLPYTVSGINLRSVSSIFLQVELPNGVEIWWDGVTRAYVDLPASFKEKTKGLCGTFNQNQKDDFLTPEDDVEQAVIPFANKWKTSERCNDVPDKLSSHPCDVNVYKKAAAEKHCSKIKSDLFKACHWFVDPEQFYMDCMYDMCSCEFQISKCLCPTISAYASECSRNGVKIEWRNEIRECGIHCPGGQKYQICSNSCTRSCTDIILRPDCKRQCVEGCNCPEGETLDDNGECIPIGRCKCQHDGLQFLAGYKEVRPAPDGPELCTCVNALWQCKHATPEEMKDFPRAEDLKTMCDASKNFEFTTCEDVEPVTCKNMHNYEQFSPAICHSGCKCKEGFVLDSKNKRCVKPTECPCHHGGRSYKENSVVQSDCNTCKCENGKWKCTDRQCTAECSAWGDSHYKTFDGKHYDYQGQCDYVLAKGSLGSESFHVSIQNIPCGSLGTSCSKSITIRINSGGAQESLTLTRDKQIPKHATMNHLTIREKGIFVIIEAPDLGFLVHWDKGTRVYVKVDPRWKGKTKGLCGNYNDNEKDDFQTPSGGLEEASAKIFGDSWRLQSYCPEALEIDDTCADRPDRKVWALKQCGVMKSPVFAACHSEVPLDVFFEKCVFDACACDQGGDCECLCTALAAYAQECNTRGVPIKWRTPHLCPMQCDERCSKYSPCISTCPLETCDNLLTNNKISKSCSEDSCVEGCSPKVCPPGEVYLNSSYSECVPRNICKPVCLEVDGVTYYEGDLMEEDSCHSCYCSREQKICKGQPCPTTIQQGFTTKQMDQILSCKEGWTKWINQDKLATKTKNGKKITDTEPLPTAIILNNLKESSRCSPNQMVGIECRTVQSHIPAKETGLNVECSLERGLVCKSEGKAKSCPDFEIRVLCQCETLTTPLSVITSPEDTVCDPSIPIHEHLTDCRKFLECSPGAKGFKLVEKTCGTDMLYNPVTRVCDWPDNVKKIKPMCDIDGENTVEPEAPECPPGTKQDDCAIQCDRLCSFYSFVVKQKGFCQDGAKCESGCVSAEKNLACPLGHLWADENTCVSLHDCLCRTQDGRPVKPGEVIFEGECTQCQCVEDFYTCHDVCATTEAIVVKKNHSQLLETLPPIVVPTSVTPPTRCEETRFLDLVQGDQPLPDDAFSASSVLSASFAPQFARINSGITEKSGGSWAPQYTNQEQYLEINLGRQEPVYGVIVRGSPLYDEYVTSYRILYSPDGRDFYYVLNGESPPRPQIFRGSADTSTPVKNILDTPFEAVKVRINPQTWNNGISLRVEIIGCKEETSTSALPVTTAIPKRVTLPAYCDDEMGLSSGKMIDHQIAVSSELSPKYDKRNVRLNSESAWQPLTNSPTEFIQFDFLEPRDITGVVTKGGDNGWVTTYVVKYSQNGKDWNPVMDEKDNKKEKKFLGNFNNNFPQVNNFELPINARFLKIIPTKWKDNIQMRVEIHGCFKPYPTMDIPATTTPSPLACNNCPGVSTAVMEIDACHCTVDLWWDGENCVNRTMCPCMVGHIPYSVGTVFEKEDCSECICKLGGVSHCNPKQCPKCKNGLRSFVTTTCACSCQSCPEGTTLCPTSNICINSTLWCNGVQDCPDDELDCTTTPTVPTVVTEPTKKPKPKKKCPIVTCQPGYRKELKNKPRTGSKPWYLSPMISGNPTKNRYKGTKGRYLGTKTGGRKGGNPIKNALKRPQKEQIIQEEEICKEYRCVSNKPAPNYIINEEECPPIVCQENFIPVPDPVKGTKSKTCPSYSCYPKPEPDAVCNVTGRTFNTFDNTEYKYDICNHVIGRDLQWDEWDVSLKKNCTTTCSRDLIIRHKDNIFVLHPDLSVEFDGYQYTVEQTKKIASQDQAFSISQLGNTLLFVSNHYGFWIIWNTLGDLKFGVVHKLEDQVDGLCGYFNGAPEDDKRKPDGSAARTTAEFGDSWALSSDQPLVCEAKACPLHIQNKAWEICNRVKEQPLSLCARVLDIEAFVSRCLETTCTCLEHSQTNHTADEKCRCDSMQSFVVDCLSADSSIDLSDWRMQQDCPATCDAPLVYHDCYQRKCEPTCESISDANVCPKVNNVCFPGCYCPPGHVRKGETCIKPSSCRDCECNLLPHLQYITYDENNFTVNGNCVYVMSRDLVMEKDGKHEFQVLITNHPCKDKPEKTCIGKVTILYQGRKIHILLDLFRNKLKLIVDNERISDFSELSDWCAIRETPTKHLKIFLTDIQIEVSVYYPSLGVSVKAPSHKYSGKLEGLCGDCNGDFEDDIKSPQGGKPKDIDDFVSSWLYENLPGGQTKEQCENKPEVDCPPLPADSDPCLQILDPNKFGQCLNILNPSLFLDWCNKDTCGGHPELACSAIEAFARDCASAGFCVNWRNEFCPAENCASGQFYDPCGRGTQRTCQDVNEKKAISKKTIPTEGCYCPDGKVLLNNTCVEPKDCKVCDAEGHHPGDMWKKDKCTTCTCDGSALNCETQHCPGLDTICERGYNAVKIPTKEEECCDKYACVPEATAGPTCETPQKLTCGIGQVMKLDTKPNGCQTFICECKPVEECDTLGFTTEAPLEPGYVQEVDDSGCCPTIQLVCKKDLCPPPKECPQYHTLQKTEIEGKCCPLYICEPPKDQCIFETQYVAADGGGERPVGKYEKQNTLKSANSTWKDGPCRECACVLTSVGNYQPACSRTECPLMELHEDFSNFELKSVPVFDQCCPKIKRAACKYDGKTYKVGEKWSKGGDNCVTMECVESEQGVQRETTVENCVKTCDTGFEYFEPKPESKECCGSCKPVACVVDGVVYKVGEEWTSSDHCTNYFCLSLNGSMQVQAVTVNCPEISKENLKDFVYESFPIEGKCCKEFKQKSCKVGDKIYQIGETWPSPDGDKCKTVTCVQNDEELTKRETKETCKKDCSKGWEYRDSPDKCCGECVQVMCVVEDELKQPNETWYSPDKCTTYVCEYLGDQLVVSSHQESCPPLGDCPEENVYIKGCCKHCNMTSEALKLCSPQSIPLNKTIGMIKYTHPPNGECINEEPLHDFTECIGTCHSSTFFNIKSGLHESICTCCQATKYEPLQVKLNCENGSTFMKTIAVPTSCDCIGCAAEKNKFTKTKSKAFTKS